MSSFLCKSILFGRYGVRNLPLTINPNGCHSLRWLSIRSNKQSFTVSYLINSLGFSQQAAVSSSKLVSFETPDKPDKAIEFFGKFGFSKTQISKLVRAFPGVLVFDSEKIILPKLEFLVSKGISRPKLAKSLSVFPSVLGISLARQITPTYNFFRNFFQSDDKAVAAFTKHPNILIDKSVGRNIAILQEYGVPYSNIATMLKKQPCCFLVNSNRFRKVVEEVVAMGFSASKTNFVVAVFALRSMNKSNWESKVDTYKKSGWSDEEFLEAFEREPRCMLASKDKISASFDFLTNKMGWMPCNLVKFPLVFAMSLEKRVIPRCSVYQLILSKGLVKKPFALASLLNPPENKFLQKFVMHYKDEVPELLKFYEEKMKLSNGSETDKLHNS